ncbi:MAG: hypothetical protein ACXWQQ_16190 [Pseudobdellovibrio sp.]
MKNKILLIATLSAVTFLSLKQIAPKKQETLPRYSLGLPFAKGSGINCDIVIQSAVQGEPAPGTYINHALDHVHDQLYRFNKMESADIEMVFCQMINRFDFNPDLSQLPQSLTFSIGNGLHTFSLDVTVPSEAFATTLGYEAKAVVKFDNNIFVTMWWSGNADASKGYLVQNLNPLAADGYKRLKYAQWDRTTAQQILKIFTADFKTSYLSQSNYPNPVDSSKLGGDRAHYGRAIYDTSSNSISAQSVEIHQDLSNPNSFACYKMMIFGTVGASISAFRPALGNPENVSSITKDGTNMDGVTGVTDSKTTADGAGTVEPAPATLPASFDFSCDDLYTAGNSGGIFQNNTVDYSLAPSTVFPF